MYAKPAGLMGRAVDAMDTSSIRNLEFVIIIA